MTRRTTPRQTYREIEAEAMAIRAGHAAVPCMPGRDDGFDIQQRMEAVSEMRACRTEHW